MDSRNSFKDKTDNFAKDTRHMQRRCQGAIRVYGLSSEIVHNVNVGVWAGDGNQDSI